MEPIVLTICVLFSGNLDINSMDCELAVMSYQASQRNIQIENPIDDFEREYFNWQVNKAVGRK